MPTLHWIGKEKVINHHLDVPFRVLEHKYGYRPGNNQSDAVLSGNKLIRGDNLEALKALLPEYEGKIKCIYIDPPYNTGNKDWMYNDNVDDPKIKQWLGKEIGLEGQDLTRHDKWLCMMYPRLRLLYQLLHDDQGMIFVSIDDNELAHLKLLMDEIFGAGNFVEYFSWIKTSTPPNLAKKSRKTAEYILCYEKNKSNRKYKAEEADGGDAPLLNTGNAVAELCFPKETLRFRIKDGEYKAGVYDRVTLHNDIMVSNSMSDRDVRLSGAFKWDSDKLKQEIDEGTTFIIKSEKFSIRYQRDTETHKAPTNLLKEKYYTPLIDKTGAGVGTNESAKKELFELFGHHAFDYPKPTTLVEFFLKLMDDPNGIVLDSFAGSGTTAHAVINLNRDGGNRKFILIEMNDYAETTTATRIKKVLDTLPASSAGHTGFDFYVLGERLFTAQGGINESVPIAKLREYIYYTETGTHLKAGPVNDKAYQLGTHENTSYYFFYEPGTTTTLDHDFLAAIREKAEQYIIYADNCILSKEFLAKANIIFKKIPRDIIRF